MNTMEKYIEDSMFEVLDSDSASKFDSELGKLITVRLRQIRESLPEEMKLEFDKTIDLMNTKQDNFCSMMYRAGFANGILAEIKMRKNS